VTYSPPIPRAWRWNSRTNHGHESRRHQSIQPPHRLCDTIIDVGDISALPHSFVSFILYTTGIRFVTGIARFLLWEKTKNLGAMLGATSILYLSLCNGYGTPRICLVSGFKLTATTGMDENSLPVRNTGSGLTPCCHHVDYSQNELITTSRSHMIVWPLD